MKQFFVVRIHVQRETDFSMRLFSSGRILGREAELVATATTMVRVFAEHHRRNSLWRSIEGRVGPPPKVAPAPSVRVSPSDGRSQQTVDALPASTPESSDGDGAAAAGVGVGVSVTSQDGSVAIADDTSSLSLCERVGFWMLASLGGVADSAVLAELFLSTSSEHRLAAAIELWRARPPVTLQDARKQNRTTVRCLMCILCICVVLLCLRLVISCNFCVILLEDGDLHEVYYYSITELYVTMLNIRMVVC